MRKQVVSNMRVGGTEKLQHVFIIGAKGLGNYGGYETFVDRLTEMHQNNPKIKYHIACKANGIGAMNERELPPGKIRQLENNRFEYHNADCFKIVVPKKMKSSQAVFYDVTALKRVLCYCKQNNIEHPIIYILACRIGPWARNFRKQIHDIGGQLYVNPDGQEWKRTKWNKLIRWYWKQSEKYMVKCADRLICDSVSIEAYIKQEYAKYVPKTVYISYGADVELSILSDTDPRFMGWLTNNNLKPDEYYLIVGRFVPENNFETMIKEFMNSHTKRSLAIVTTQNIALLNELDIKLHWRSDDRIKFVGTVYDKELLKKIRENAYGYIHGHSVGGTNPSLLEALGSTKINLVYNVSFNKEVGQDTVIYWTKEEGVLAHAIDGADTMSNEKREEYGNNARARIKKAYSWQFIADQYEKLFLGMSI